MAQQWNSPPDMQIDPEARYHATMETEKGTIELDLYPEHAPKTVNNFVFLAEEGFYDGVIFHRVIDNFMIQGGDPTGTGRGGPGYQFEDEIERQSVLHHARAAAASGWQPHRLRPRHRRSGRRRYHRRGR